MKNIFKKLSIFVTVIAMVICGPFIATESHADDTMAVYRLHNAKTGEFLYTTDANEINVLTGSGAWKNNGIAWNAPASGNPVYRLNFPKASMHLYTKDPREMTVLVAEQGWTVDNGGAPMFYSGGEVEINRLLHPKSGNHLLTANPKEYSVLTKDDWKGEGVAIMALSLPGAPSQNQNPTTETKPVETPVVHTPPAQSNTNTSGTINHSYVRGVWFSFLDWQTSLKGKNEADFRSSFVNICNRIRQANLNTIYLHVRSHNDAVYQSAIYPWSAEMLSGVPNYDPLSIMVEEAHRNGISLQAWINPYGYRNGTYAGDPSIVTKDNILAGIREILTKYNVDGIHFDDYFPVMDKSVHNELVRESYALCHSYGKIFGISPQGNIDNNRAMGADIDTWLSQAGYLDYITPQIYWTDQYGSNGNVTMYSDRVKAWTALNKINLPMYVGLATYRAGVASSTDPGWSRSMDNLKNQINIANSHNWKGFVHFRYDNLNQPEAQAELANIQ